MKMPVVMHKLLVVTRAPRYSFGATSAMYKGTKFAASPNTRVSAPILYYTRVVRSISNTNANANHKSAPHQHVFMHAHRQYDGT